MEVKGGLAAGTLIVERGLLRVRQELDVHLSWNCVKAYIPARYSEWYFFASTSKEVEQSSSLDPTDFVYAISYLTSCAVPHPRHKYRPNDTETWYTQRRL